MHARISQVLWLLCLPVFVDGKPVCEFENLGERRISGDNPNDFRCIQLQAEAGDAFQQYYLGLILIGHVPGPQNISEGIALLKKVARAGGKHSADAMRFIGEVYKRPNTSLQNYELSYQWFYLASQQPQFKGLSFPLPDAKLSAELSPQRIKELEQSASSLLKMP